MIFNSTEFILGFLPIFILLYYITPVRYRNITLLVSSIIFYAYGEPVYVFLLIGSMLVNFSAGKLLSIDAKLYKEKARGRRRALCVILVAADVLVLVFFKGVPAAGWAAVGVGLPLGISFYTFQILSYVLDVYKGEIKAERSIVNLGTYICMFPQLVAGPIVRYGEVSEELRKRAYSLKGFDQGLKRFVYGLSMKVLVADRLAILWNDIQTVGVVSISTPYAWLGVLAFTLQIYLDFYGYSVMATGLGLMLGFHLPDNFDLPYMAKSVREFYRRWHMTLGRWFQKYVYIPLGGNRKGRLRTVLNLLIVWLLTGFWHGGSLHFLVWGLSLWALIVMERLIDRSGWLSKSKVIGHVYLLFVISLSWLIFALPDLASVGVYFGRLFGVREGVNVNLHDFAKALGDYWGLLATGVFLCTPIPMRIFKKYQDNVAGMCLLAVLFWMCVWRIMVEGNNPFLYFRF